MDRRRSVRITEGPVPMSARSRRCSAPSHPSTFEVKVPDIPLRREWVTKQLAIWRTGPSLLSQKLGDIPAGLQVIESESPHSFPMQCGEGWIPIAPKGFLQTSDLAVVSSGDYSGAALAALREEGVKLREVNVGLREQELVSRKELGETKQSVNDLTKELELLHVRCEAEEGRLERFRVRRADMEEKLKACANVVKHTVDCMDRFHADKIGVAEARQAGLSVADALESISALESKQDARTGVTFECISALEAKQDARTDVTFVGQENETAKPLGVIKEIAEPGLVPKRQPLRERNTALA